MTGRVYCIGEKPGGPVKVGHSCDPDARRAAMQSSSHLKMQVLASCPGTRGHEATVHLRFADFWIRGEWFTDLDCQITELIQSGNIGANAHTAVLHEIEQFMTETGMSRSKLGTLALSNPSFMTFLGEGSSFKFHTIKRVRTFMADYRSAQAAAE